MQPRHPAMYLYEIVDAAEHLARYTAGLAYDAYLQARVVRAATEATLIRVGRMLQGLREHAPETAALLPAVGELIALGEHVLCDYDNVDHVAVWDAVQTDLPALRAQSQALLARADAETPVGTPQASAVIPLIEERRQALGALCRRHRVRRLEVFGSAARGDFDPERSDLDFMVEFLALEDGQYAASYFGLLFGLEDLFACHVDLVMTSAIRNPYFAADIAHSRTTLYAA